MKVVNPANNQLIKELSEDTAESVGAKFKAAQDAQKLWAKTSLSERVKVLQNFRQALVSDENRLAEILTSEVGKPIKQSHNEVKGVLGRIDFFIENVAKVLEPREVFSDNPKELISLEPLGVVANISAWNYPYFVGSNVFVPALLTGNAVMYKPSEFSTLTGIALGELFEKAGLPRGLFQVLIGGGSVGEALLAQKINGVFFTGSYNTGKKISQAVSKKIIKIQLELGGKDPTYVAEDVDVNTAAASLADGAFYNNGQSCCSVERIYVHEKIYDSFVAAFVAEVQSFVMGDPMSENTYIGPLTRAAQMQVLDYQVKDALSKGGKLLCGGRAKSEFAEAGNYFEPTVFSNVSHAMALMVDESFGPIIGIQKVSNDEQALELMNETGYGLTAGVYSKDEARARKILSQVKAGTVYWNCCDRVSPRLPWSGRGHSGIGSTLSMSGIEAFTQPKAWHLKNTTV
jgi:acyl-CoA reductase-like NAD-dependent aldehyde dehydrogenase